MKTIGVILASGIGNRFGSDVPKQFYKVDDKMIISFVVPIMQIAYTVATWKNDGKIIRTVRLYAVTPAWLSYNIVMFSIGGIICEGFNIISIIVSFIRHRKDGFEK